MGEGRVMTPQQRAGRRFLASIGETPTTSVLIAQEYLGRSMMRLLSARKAVVDPLEDDALVEAEEAVCAAMDAVDGALRWLPPYKVGSEAAFGAQVMEEVAAWMEEARNRMAARTDRPLSPSAG